MKMHIQRANERGKSDLGWLQSRFSFSFANYYDPTRMGFGALRVLNDDIVKPGYGFGEHPHDNMEIISIPLEGALAHKDSTGVEEVVNVGDVQVMSAGTGIEHSEYNHSKTHPAKFFQIWIEPKTQDIKPRHDKKSFVFEKNALTKIVSGTKSKDSLFIHQDAHILIGTFDANNTCTYALAKHHGAFIIVIDGSITVAKQQLENRDSIEISQTDNIEIIVNKNSRFLLIDVPMHA